MISDLERWGGADEIIDSAMDTISELPELSLLFGSAAAAPPPPFTLIPREYRLLGDTGGSLEVDDVVVFCALLVLSLSYFARHNGFELKPSPFDCNL